MYETTIRDGHTYVKKYLVTNNKYLLVKYIKIKHTTFDIN